VTSWTDHVKALGVGLLSNGVNSWMTGINSNVEGKRARNRRAATAQRAGYAQGATRWRPKHYDELVLA